MGGAHGGTICVMQAPACTRAAGGVMAQLHNVGDATPTRAVSSNDSDDDDDSDDDSDGDDEDECAGRAKCVGGKLSARSVWSYRLAYKQAAK